MLNQSLPASRFRSRPASGAHALTDLTALALSISLSVSPREGCTVHSPSSGLSVSTTSHTQEVP